MRRVLVWFGLCWFLVAGCGSGGGGTKPEEYQISPEEQEIIGLTNEVRAQENVNRAADLPAVNPLNVDPVLCKVARAHSIRLAKTGRPSPMDGKLIEKGLQDSGYAFEISGFAGSKYKEGGLGKAFAGVVQQKQTGELIVKPEFQDLGVGIAANEGKTEFFLTQVFAKKRNK